jgi:hypothetical protein
MRKCRGDGYFCRRFEYGLIAARVRGIAYI